MCRSCAWVRYRAEPIPTPRYIELPAAIDRSETLP